MIVVLVERDGVVVAGVAAGIAVGAAETAGDALEAVPEGAVCRGPLAFSALSGGACDEDEPLDGCLPAPGA